MRIIKIAIYIMVVFLIMLETVVYGGIEDTKHNLSVTGPGPVKSTTEDRICVFCHAPDRSITKKTYLWNRRLSRAHYVPYQSSTLYANVGQPTGSSKLCLSCHDGTIALGDLISVRGSIPFAGGIRFIPEGPARIGTDLSDDHPVSFVYDSSLAISNGELVDPYALPQKVKLDQSGQMQCTTCHDAHNNDFGKFLVMSNYYSDLCTTCHQKDGWSLSSHSSSSATWSGGGPDPWPHTSYMSVAENGCENCHIPHTAGGHERLLNYVFEEDNCLVCHNGNVADTDIEKELSKFYAHAVQDYTGVHDPAENLGSGSSSKQKHVECFDCHNAHMSSDLQSPGAPQVSGAIQGVTGVNLSGQDVRYSVNQYEICFKCHADNNMIDAVEIDRDLQQLNTRLEFNPSNPSFHPVAGQGANPDVPSLLPPYTTTSIIFCTDCHNTENRGGPQGPHGSVNKYLLEMNYETMDFSKENSFNYALCYKCHDRTSILNDNSFSEHNRHIVDEKTPCSACHDAHGISVTQGNPTNNSNLINFDLTIVTPDSQGRLYFEDTGLFKGTCALTCHGSDHLLTEYP
jgi:predicted CXXCH cytochrome family protein